MGCLVYKRIMAKCHIFISVFVSLADETIAKFSRKLLYPYFVVYEISFAHSYLKVRSFTWFCLFVCLFELWFSVQVNSYGHVGTLSPFNGTCAQN